MNPFISIILPSYNYANFLPRCIESVLSQDYEDFELIIVEDVSTDESLSIIKQYVDQDNRISLIKHPQNLGVCAALNTGIKHARGTYCLTLSADDYYLPGMLSQTIPFVKLYPDCGLAFSDFATFTENQPNTISSHQLLPNETSPVVLSPSEFRKRQFKRTFWIPGNTVLVKRELLHKYGCFNPAFEALTDWVLYHSIALVHGAIYIPETLTAFRQADSSYGGQFHADSKRLKRAYRSALSHITSQPVLSKVFRKSCLLSHIFKKLLLSTIIQPKFWPFFFMLAKRKLRSVIANSSHTNPP